MIIRLLNLKIYIKGKVMQDYSELIERIKRQDEKAISELYHLTYKKAYMQALSFMGSPDKVDDVLQNAYINIFNRIDTLKNPETLFSWIYTIVANTCKSELRKKQNFSFSDIEDYHDLDIEEDHREFIPDQNTNYEHDRKVVIDFIGELPLEQRSALVMYIYDDMKISEIADVFECSENTIKSRISYAKKTLKEKIIAYKKKGNTLFAVPLIPYLRFILKENEKLLKVNQLSHYDMITSNITTLNESSKDHSVIVQFVSQYRILVNALIATITAAMIASSVPSNQMVYDCDAIKNEMLAVYEEKYLNGTNATEVLEGFEEAQKLLRQYMEVNEDKTLNEYYSELFSWYDHAPQYRSYLADKVKPTSVIQIMINYDDIPDLICLYERTIDSPGSYIINEYGECIKGDKLTLNDALILSCDESGNIIELGKILDDYKYAKIRSVHAGEDILIVSCHYGNTYRDFISSNMLLEYRILDNKLKLIQSFDLNNPSSYKEEDYPFNQNYGISTANPELYSEYK